MVKHGNVDVAILPVWCFGETYRDNFISLLKSNLYEVGEIYLPDLHRLLALTGVSQEDLKTVISDRYSLFHCDHVLTKINLANRIEFYDTAVALSVAKFQLPMTRVIASGAAINLYGLHTLSLWIHHRIF
jgi:prephenate dehydratase